MNIKLSILIEQLKKLESAREQVELVASSSNALNGNVSNLLEEVNQLILGISSDFPRAINNYTQELRVACQDANKIINNDLIEYKNNQETINNNFETLKVQFESFKYELFNSTSKEVEIIRTELNNHVEKQFLLFQNKLESLSEDYNRGLEILKKSHTEFNKKNVEIINKYLEETIRQYNETLYKLKDNTQVTIEGIVKNSIGILKPYIDQITDLSSILISNMDNMNQLLANNKDLDLITQLKDLADKYTMLKTTLDNISYQQNTIATKISHIENFNIEIDRYTKAVFEQLKNQNKTILENFEELKFKLSETKKSHNLQSYILMGLIVFAFLLFFYTR